VLSKTFFSGLLGVGLEVIFRSALFVWTVDEVIRRINPWLSWDSRCVMHSGHYVLSIDLCRGAIWIFSCSTTVTKNEMLGEWATSHVDLAPAAIQQTDAGQ